MLKKTILGIAAAAAFGAAALAPTSASAHWYHHHHYGWWGFYGPGFYYAGCYPGKRWVWTPGGWILVHRSVCY
ncbi:MAG TPA: hypothetical protein VKT73_09110 [Xanthobacteraceae bacterium]|nr:hypothetical protein [Xanthobacteraceae bacterium]